MSIPLLSICLFTHVYAKGQNISAGTAIVFIKSQDTTRYPVRLMYTDDNQPKFLSCDKAVHGIYEFHIPVRGYSKALLYIASAKSIIVSGQSFIPQPAPQFLIKGGEEVSIVANFNNPLEFTLKSGDPEILLFESFSRQERQNRLMIWDLMKIKYGQPENKVTAELEIAKHSKALNAFEKEFVAHNPNSFAALLVFESYYTELGALQALQQLKTMAKGYQDTENWKTLSAKLQAAIASSKGAKIPVFKAVDLDGKTFDSQNLNGKYLLIDFWGSWCQPCRASHPELKAIYEEYKSKGLEILGIAYESGSVESQVHQWKKAIQEDQINWIQVLNTVQNNLVKLFGVTSYPTKILVDPKGNILVRASGSSVELKKQLKEIFGQNSHSAISSNKTITRDSLFNYLNKKLNENTVESKAVLRVEAEALKKSTDEDDLLLALKLYGAIGDDAIGTALEKNILQKFPNGIMARDLAYEKIFGAKPELAIDVLETQYLSWLKKYPASTYRLKNREKYNFSLFSLIVRFSKANRKDKVDYYLAQLSEPNLKTTTLFNVGKEYLDRKEASAARPYLSEALALSETARHSDEPKIRNGFAAMYYSVIVNVYSAALLMDGQISESVKMAAGLLDQNGYSGMNSDALVLTLAKGLIGRGEKLNAFLALDKYLHKNPLSPEIMDMSKSLYQELNGEKSDFQQYADQLIAGKQKEQREHFKNVMVKEKAPLFSLYNRKGELVNLADYKGKVVVLDFWATWCVPCIQSFPGMQATIDRYKDNKDVEFLFIDTWETKAEFERSVNEIIDQHQYAFNVLYDRQKDKNEEIAAKKYGISAIPAKFVLDKDGYIRFKISSSPTDKASVLSEMSTMIDMVLGMDKITPSLLKLN